VLILCILFVCIIVFAYVYFIVFVVFLCSFLQNFDTVGWVFWPVKTVGRITYTVLVQTLNHAQSIKPHILESPGFFSSKFKALKVGLLDDMQLSVISAALKNFPM